MWPKCNLREVAPIPWNMCKCAGKSLKIVATRCQILRLNIHQIRFRLGLHPRLHWGSAVSKLDLRGPTSKGREGKRQGKEGKSYILLPNFFVPFVPFQIFWASSNVIVVIAASMAVRKQFKYVTTWPASPPSLMFHFLKSSWRSLLLELRFLAWNSPNTVGGQALPGPASGAKVLPKPPSRNKGA